MYPQMDLYFCNIFKEMCTHCYSIDVRFMACKRLLAHAIANIPDLNMERMTVKSHILINNISTNK